MYVCMYVCIVTVSRAYVAYVYEGIVCMSISYAYVSIVSMYVSYIRMYVSCMYVWPFLFPDTVVKA
jgi:hypothetical protein